MKPTDKDLISKLSSLPESALAELLAMLEGGPDGPGDATKPAVAPPGWATGAAEDAQPLAQPRGRA